MDPKDRYLEDYAEGDTLAFGEMIVGADEIVAFAQKFDPQPFHLTEEAGAKTPFGGLVASGWHTAGMTMRMMVDHIVSRHGLGSPGVDELRWLKPVRPGDTITAWVECAGKVPSKSRPEMGVVHEHWRATNQKGELVFTCKGINMVRRRPA